MHAERSPFATDHAGMLSHLFEEIGGLETLNKLAAFFYARVEADDRLRPMFKKDLNASQRTLALFLGELTGGPKEYSKASCPAAYRVMHGVPSIGPDQIGAWLRHMNAALDETELPEPAKTLLRRYFEEEGNALKDPLYETRQLTSHELRAWLHDHPDGLHIRDGLGRTLLHRAAGEWDADRVRCLLELGAEADAESLFQSCNRQVHHRERWSESGRSVIRLLIDAGADPNARSGSGAQTPLHITARRGNISLAEALMDARAELDAQDNKGETALRRAVNCRQHGMAAWLLGQGADASIPDRHGMTPLQAAMKSRSAVIRALFKE